MVVGTVNKCIKLSLFVFNFLCVLVGIILIGVGVSTINGFKYMQLVDHNSFGAPPKLFIAIGAIMLIIAFLGCCGAYMENHAMIMCYSVLVGLVLVLQLGVGISAFLLKDDVEKVAEEAFMQTLKRYHNLTDPESADIRRSWDIVQSELHCCGVNNYTNWNGTLSPFTDPPKNETLVPSSCCIEGIVEMCAAKITDANIWNEEEAKKIIYTEGCVEKAIDQLAITRIGWVGIGLGVVEIFGILCACLLARSIRFSYETV